MQERKRSVARRALAAAVLILSSAPLPASATDPGSCGRAYTASASCVFGFNGLPLVFFGNAEVSSGMASVQVRITPDGYPDVVLFSCASTAARFAQCDDGFPDQSTDPGDFLHQMPRLRLRCFVDGTASGTFGCKAGLG